MPITFDVDRQERLVRVSMEEEVSLVDFAEYRRLLAMHPEFAPELPRLLDVRDMTLPPDTRKIRDLAEAMVRQRDQLPARRAIIAQRDVLYGMFRMLETLVDLDGGPPVRVFRNEEEALHWLRDPWSDGYAEEIVH